MPQAHSAAYETAVELQSGEQIIQQGSKGREIDDAERSPILSCHLAEEREGRSFGLAACGRSEKERVIARHDRSDSLFLERMKSRPSERIYDVVLDRGVHLLEPAHAFGSRP